MIKTDQDDRRLHDEFVRYGMNVKEWMRKCVLLLPEIAKRRIWEKKGFSCISEYAGKLAGMSHKTVIDALRILKKIEDKPKLKKIAEEKGLNCIKPIVTFATKENEGFWAAKIKEMSKNTLTTFVKELKKEKTIDFAHQKDISEKIGEAGLSNKKVHLLIDLSPKTAEKLEKLKGTDSWENLFNELLAIREQKIELIKPQVVQTRARHIPNSIKKFLSLKTRRVCAFPGCKKQGEILHHTKRFSLYKTHDPDSIVPLCKAHERLAHLGLVENENMPPENWEIHKNPDTEYINSKKFLIDKIVNKFRNPYVNSA